MALEDEYAWRIKCAHNLHEGNLQKELEYLDSELQNITGITNSSNLMNQTVYDMNHNGIVDDSQKSRKPHYGLELPEDPDVGDFYFNLSDNRFYINIE